MKTWLLTVGRHMLAVMASLVIETITTHGVTLAPEQEAQITGGITALGIAIMLAVYAVAEKALKPIFHRYFGELQPGELPPDITAPLRGSGRGL